ncbi:MAG: hypothetical protein EXR52_03905 [Dehalococcoidia bacterium]|nr:hypothetical protein [Dehalococcoidia bacterium]
MSQTGEIAIWNGHGIGTTTPDGSIKFAASVAYQAGDDKLEPLNHILVVVEHTAGGDGTASSTLWEWKV